MINRIFYTNLLWLCIFKILPTSHDIIYTIFSRQFDILINCALAIRASQNLGLRFLITVTRHSFEKATWKENLYFSIINCFQSAVKNPSSKIMLINVKHRFVPKGLLIHYYLYRVLGKNKLHLKFYTNLSSFLFFTLHSPIDFILTFMLVALSMLRLTSFLTCFCYKKLTLFLNELLHCNR